MPITFRRRDNLKGTEAEHRIGVAIHLGFNPLGDFLVNSLKQRAPVDQKKYQRSIKKRISGRGLKTRLLVFASAKHAEFVEKGRPGGGFPPPNVLLAWVRRHGLGASTFSLKTQRATSVGTRRIFNRKEGRLRSRGQSLLRIQKSIAFLIGRRIAKGSKKKPAGIPGKFHFRDLKQDYASQISSSLTRIRALVAQQLNSG